MKRILFSCLILLASIIGGSVSAFDNGNSYIHVEKATKGGYASGRDGIQSFASTQDIIFTTEGRNISDDVNIKVFEANMDDVLEYLVYRGEGEQINADISVDDMDLITTMNVHKGDDFSLPVDGNGVWLVHVQADKADVFMYVIRSKYGTIVKESENGLLMWVQNFDNGESMTDVPVMAYSLRDKVKKRTESHTDNEGIAHTDTSAKYDVIVVGDENEALVPLNLEHLNINYKNEDNKYQGQKERVRNFIFTDRPIYKPGDKVYFKAISRLDDDLVYRVTGGKWKAQIIKGWGDSREIIAEGDYDMDSYGSISGEFVLPENLKTGIRYRLEISNDKYKGDGFYGWFNNNYSVDLQVEHYRKPEYEISVALNNHEHINKEQISFTVDGNYFSGEVLSRERIEYVIRENNFWDSAYLDSFLNSSRRYSYGYAYGKEVKRGYVQLDQEGHAQVLVPTAISDGKTKVYTVEVSYKPVTGEPVIDQESAVVHAGEYGVYRKDYQHSFQVNEDAVIDFVLHGNVPNADMSGKPIKISGVHTWWDVVDNDARYRQYKRQEENVPAKTIITNEHGQAQFQFTPQKTGSYKFSVESEDQFGNLIKKDFSIWVGDRHYFVPEQNNGLTLSVDKKEYSPQESVVATITSQTVDRDVLLDIERDFVHNYQIVHLDKNVKDITIELKEEYTPNMVIKVVSFSHDGLDEAQKQIDISAQSKKLDIVLSTNKEKYGPGEEVTVDVETKDQNGNPQKADVAVWAVDKALFELVQRGNYDIHGTYWKKRPGYTSTTNSLRGIWIQTAEMGGCFSAGTQVLLGDGSTKNIEDIQENDKVLTFAEDGSGELISARVAKTHNAVVDGLLVINNTLKITDNHIIWVNNTWKKAGDVRIGDYVRDKNGQKIIVENIAWHSGKEKVYNLIVENVHTYIVDGYFVHNGKDSGGRSAFEDVAYWNPRVRTGDDGKAQISFELPDNLTTWIISAIGATKETIVGNTDIEIRTTKAVIIRPQVPNILRVNDESVLVASAHNNTSEDRTFIATLELEKGIANKAQQQIRIPAGESRIVTWAVTPEYVDEPVGFTFSLTANDNEKLTDSVYKEVPIEKFGFWETDSMASAGAGSYEVQINNDARNEDTTVDLTITSTALSSLTGAMNYLIHYPYGCMEQTTSAFMPAVLAKENPSFFKEALEGKDIDDIIAIGVKRLSDRQSDDGGWSWWGGNSDVFLSAYVTEYLLRAQEQGATVDSVVIQKARGYFENKKVANEIERVMTMYGRSLVKSNEKWEVVGLDELDADLVAMAVMANVRNGFTDKTTNGYNVLMSKLQNRGHVSYWPTGAKERFGSIDASSGVALRAVMMAEGDMQKASRVMNYFLESRKKEYWSSTFATSQILEGFIEYENYEKEQSQNYEVEVFIDNQSLGSKIFNATNVVETIKIPIDMIEDEGSTISIKPSEEGVTLYSTLLKREYHTNTSAESVSRTISIDRTYSNIKGKNYSIGIGDTVAVDFVVKGLKKGDSYLMIEDQLPAGIVPLNENLDNVKKSKTYGTIYNYVGKEYTKNGVIISDSHIGSDGEQHYYYNARVVAGGDYSVPPAQAMLMYSPEIYAHSGSEIIHIENESQIVDIEGDEIITSEKNKISFRTIAFAIIGFITFGAFVAIWIFHNKS